jgi:hypothetical protein
MGITLSPYEDEDGFDKDVWGLEEDEWGFENEQ